MSVPDQFHISWRNDIASYTMEADVTVEDAYPLTNCQNPHANEWTVFDMTGETTVVITGSSATERSATCFAMHNHDAPDGTTVRLELFPNESQGGTATYDSTATDVMHNVAFGELIAGYDPIEGNYEDTGHLKTHFSLWFETVTYKSWRITITNATGFTNDALKIDKLWLGFAWYPPYGIDHGGESTIIDDSEHTRKKGGGMETVEDCLRRSLRVQFNPASLENVTRNRLRFVFDQAKMGGDLLVTLDPNNARSQNYETTSIYRRTNAVSFVSAFYNGNEHAIALEEN